MKKNNRLTIRPVKLTVSIILMAFISILICFMILKDQRAKRDYKDKIILYQYGKQKMYVQEISKDAALLYSVLLNKDGNGVDLYLSSQLSRMDEIKDSLRLAKELFSQTLENTQRGHLSWDEKDYDISIFLSKTSDKLNDITTLWDDFKVDIDILVNAEKIDDEVTEAAYFIANSNLELMEYCDNLEKIILDESIDTSEKVEIIFKILIGLLSVIIVAAIFTLVRFIILPFNTLYQGLSEIGLNEIPRRPGFPTRKKIVPMVDEINDMFLKIDDLISLIQNMNNNSSFTEVLNFINRTFSKIIPYNYIGIALLNNDKTKLISSYGVSDGLVKGLPEKMMGLAFDVNDTSLGNLIDKGEPRIINDLEKYVSGKPMKAYNRIILDAGIRASITLPLKVSGEPIGIIFFSSINKNVYHAGHLNFLGTLADSIAISFYQNAYIDQIIYSSVLALAKLAEARDIHTGKHLEKMKVYSRIIAEILHERGIYSDEITWEFINDIERYSPLHDVGKVGIADSILLKPGKLTDKEYEEMKKHTIYGAEVLKVAEQNINRKGHSLFGLGIEIAEGHHEKWDGSGYPFGKKGYEIPLSARIVAIADVLDALTSRRPYKEPLTFEESMKIIEEGKGTHFDPIIVDAVMASKHKLRKAYYTFMNEKDNSNTEAV